jgi:hypothetical protein
MKRYVYIAPAALLILFFVVLSSFPSPFDCSAKITIYNVIIDGQSKTLYQWGNCRDVQDADTYRVIPCSRTWIVEWGGILHISYCMGTREEDESESWYDEEYESDDKEDELFTCEKYSVRITFAGVKGLDTTLTLRDNGLYTLKAGVSGLEILSGPP